MKRVKWKMICAAVAAVFAPLQAEVPELLSLVPDAKGYEIIYKLNPLEFGTKGFQINNGEVYSGTLKRIGYLLKLTDNEGKLTWIFVSMDPFSQNLKQVGVPNAGSGVVQTYVNNMEIYGNSSNVKNGKFEKGNIEFWSNNYGGKNAKEIPGATDALDFGDTVYQHAANGYGSMQVHNYQEKQTVFAFNKLKSNKDCDLGIGNNPTKGKSADWTFSSSGRNYKNAELFVVGQFDNLKIDKVTKPDPLKVLSKEK